MYAAADGEEALAILEKNKDIALVMVDLVMPRMNGADFADALSSRRPSTRMLFISGHTENVLRRKGISRNGANFIAKPFSLKLLAVKIREILEEPAPARAAAATAGV
jgi:YesN/AraC family two-component response regulator